MPLVILARSELWNAEVPKSKQASLYQPGAAIRGYRQRLGLTLRDVSAKTGLAISTLSKLEMGRASLSFEKMVKVSEGLGVEVSDLLGSMRPPGPAPAAAVGRRVIQRLGDGVVVETNSYRHVFLANELLNRRMVPILATVNARSIDEVIAEFGDLIRHPGEEFAMVVEGEVEFHSEHYAPVRLKVGESIYFDSGMGHGYVAVSPGRCTVMSVCYGEERHLGEALRREP